jgi:hypothetical protein
MKSTKPNQLNIRIDSEIERALDAKRIELAAVLGYIPSRSELVRKAIEQFLSLPPTAENAVMKAE